MLGRSATKPLSGSARESGDAAERFAESWLRAKGFELLERQVSCRFGEIDLVMRRKRVLALVEVKYRAKDLSAAILSVSPVKQKKLSLAASWLYSQRPQWQSLEWRFDVLAVAGDMASPEVQWVPAAFELLGE
jgi:putative endonuclease